MDEKLTKILHKIQLLCEQNSEFYSELRNMFDSSAIPPNGGVLFIQKDVHFIREALSIRANCSIDYSFVKDTHLRDMLTIDNLRMENVAIDFSEKDEYYRLFRFCVNAFYQIDGLINYYFKQKNLSIEEVKKYIAEATKDEENETWRYNPEIDKNIPSIESIAMYYKLNAFFNVELPNKKGIKQTAHNIRQIRNITEHRSVKEGENSLKAYKYVTFNIVRSTLIQIANTVKAV